MNTQYYIKARLFPAVLTSIPLLLVVNEIINNIYYDELRAIYKVLPYITNLGFSTSLIFMFVQINRVLAKEIFQNLYFLGEINMPTSTHLLWKDNFFDKSVKIKIRSKINERFGLSLMEEEEEKFNESKSRSQIVTAVSQIRNSLRENKLLFQHNIEYGFFRNLIGGCVIAIICSISLYVYGVAMGDQLLKTIAIITTAIYFIPILLSKFFLKKLGVYYSKILYEQFLTY